MRALLRMKRNQNGAALLALGLAAAVSLLFAQTLTRRLRRLTRDAQAYNRASGPFRTTVDGRDEIAELAQALNRMAAELEARQRYNRDFLGDIAHEIRTPITSLRAATELLEQQRDAPPERREALARVVQNAIRRVERMVGELYSLTKLDARMAQEPRERVDYPALVREILERLEPTFDPPRAALVFTPPARAASVRVAPGRIEQVLANLLENAFRYTPPEGRVEVVVEDGPDGEIRTLVRDTGRGIAPENLNKVFDRFFTTEPADGSQDHGSGLGLTIARTIVEHHRGRIGVESAPGQGSTFWFTLPRAD